MVLYQSPIIISSHVHFIISESLTILASTSFLFSLYIVILPFTSSIQNSTRSLLSFSSLGNLLNFLLNVIYSFLFKFRLLTLYVPCRSLPFSLIIAGHLGSSNQTYLISLTIAPGLIIIVIAYSSSLRMFTLISPL